MAITDGGVQATMPVMPSGYGGMGGFGNMGGDGWWIILVLLFAMNGWGGGWGGNNGNSDLALLAAMNSGRGGAVEGFTQSNDFSNLERENDIIRSDICNNFANVNQTLANGFQGVATSFAQAELSRSNTQAALMSQLYNMSMADLQRGCDTQAAINTGFAQTNYNMAQQGCETRSAIQNGNRDIIEKLSAMEFNTIQRENEALRSENQGLKFQISQGAQNMYLTNTLRPYPIPTFTVVAPGTTTDGAARTTAVTG